MSKELRLILLLAGTACAAPQPSVSAPPPSAPATQEAATEEEPDKPVGKVGMEAALFYRKTENPTLCGIELLDLNQVIGPEAAERRPVVVTFAAKHCHACLKELKAYSARPEAINDSGALFVVIVNDPEDATRAEMVTLLKDQYKLPFPLVDDVGQILTRRYGVGTLPHTTLVGADGRIRWVKTGYSKATSLKELVQAVKSAK